jgi:hypothetical protein
MASVGGFEVRDRKDANAGVFKVEAVEYDAQRSARPHHCKALPNRIKVTSSITGFDYPLPSSQEPNRL